MPTTTRLVPPNERLVPASAPLGARERRPGVHACIFRHRERCSCREPAAVPISFTIDASQGLLRTVVTGRPTRDEIMAYAEALRVHPDASRVDRRLVDVRAMSAPDADELAHLLLVEHRLAGSLRRADRRAILTIANTGPALGRELAIGGRSTLGPPIAYRVFRDPAAAHRYLRIRAKG